MKQLCYVDGTKCNTFSVGRKRPPTSVWTMELLSERENAEVLAGGLGLGETEGHFVEEEEDPAPENVEVILPVFFRILFCVHRCWITHKEFLIYMCIRDACGC